MPADAIVTPRSMRRAGACIVLAFAATLAPAAWALDLVQAWQGAEQHAPDAAAARAAREAGAARGTQAQALWRPNVMLEGGASYASHESATRGAQFSAPGFGQSTGVSFDTSVTGGTATRYAVALRQPVYSRERSARSRQLEIAAEAAVFEWTQSRQDLMLRTADAYFDTALAHERLRLIARQQNAVDHALTEARDRFRIGDRPVIDVHEATARAAALQSERLAAETRLQLSRTALTDLTGLPTGDAPLPLPGEVRIDDVGALPDWLSRADRHNPGLRLAASQVQAAQAQARGSRQAASPTVDVVAQLGRERLSGDGDYGNASNTNRNAAIGVQIALPLYTGGLRSAQHTEHLALVDQASRPRPRPPAGRAANPHGVARPRRGPEPDGRARRRAGSQPCAARRHAGGPAGRRPHHARSAQRGERRRSRRAGAARRPHPPRHPAIAPGRHGRRARRSLAAAGQRALAAHPPVTTH